MSYQKRSSTEPEPSTVDLIFAVVFIVVVIGCFAVLWFDCVTEFGHQVLRHLGARRIH